jgi:hypothetical protein
MDSSSKTSGKADLDSVHWSHYLTELRVAHVLSLVFLALAADYA